MAIRKKVFAQLIHIAFYTTLFAAVVISFVPGTSDSLEYAVIGVFGIGVLVLKVIQPIRAFLRFRDQIRSRLVFWADLITGISMFVIIVLVLFTNLQVHWLIMALVAGLSILVSIFDKDRLLSDS